MQPDTLMIFAAGFGTRMGALTSDRPKPLLRIDGTTLIDRTIALARDAGVDRIVVNTHYLADQVAAHLDGSGVTVLREEPAILDTGGGLKAACSHLGSGSVFTANPDVAWLGPNPFPELAARAPDWAEAVLLLVEADACETRKGGDFAIGPDGRLTRGGGMIYTGLQIIRAGTATEIPDQVFSLNAVWDRLEARGTLAGVAYSGRWCDVGSPRGLARAEELLTDPGDA